MKHLKKFENYTIEEDCGCQSLSEDLNYALNEGLVTSFRYGSEKFFQVINEARENMDNLSLTKEDIDFLNTDIGKKGIYNGKEVWLDFPMLENYVEEYVEVDLGDIVYDDMGEKYEVSDINDYHIELNSLTSDESSISFPMDFGDIPVDDFWNYFRKEINEKTTTDKYKGKKSGKPSRNKGGKAYKVYVAGCNEKTKSNPRGIKKVTFGSGMRAKINDQDARSNYDSRHGCSEGKHNDKCKAGYWSCRLPRYAKALGLSYSGSAQWW